MRDPSSKILKCYKCQSSERSKLQTAADTMLLLMRDPNSKVLQVPRKWRSKLQNGAVQMPGKTTSTRKREKNPKRNGGKKKCSPFQSLCQDIAITKILPIKNIPFNWTFKTYTTIAHKNVRGCYVERVIIGKSWKLAARCSIVWTVKCGKVGVRVHIPDLFKVL